MPAVRSYKDLNVWQASMDLVDVCFEIVEGIRHPYRFIFCDQLMRAGVSIPSNIAEGHRRSTKGFLNHLSYSLGSLIELETVIELLLRRDLDQARARRKVRASLRVNRSNAPCPGRILGDAVLA